MDGMVFHSLAALFGTGSHSQQGMIMEQDGLCPKGHTAKPENKALCLKASVKIKQNNAAYARA